MNGLEKTDIYINSNESQNPKPLHLFITSGTGVGKYDLIHTLKIFPEKNFAQITLNLLKKSNWSVNNRY